jgi:hypothetical protein
LIAFHILSASAWHPGIDPFIRQPNKVFLSFFLLLIPHSFASSCLGNASSVDYPQEGENDDGFSRASGLGDGNCTNSCSRLTVSVVYISFLGSSWLMVAVEEAFESGAFN